MNLFIKIIFLYLFFFLSKAYSCNFNNLDIDKDIKKLEIDEIFLIKQNVYNDYGKYFFPIEAFCENNYQGIIIDIDTFKDKIFKISFINQISSEKKALSISINEYAINFNFEENNSEKKIIKSKLQSKNKHFNYTYLLNENDENLEIFEIIDPETNNLFRETLNIDEEQ